MTANSPSAASLGGSGGASGVGFQNLVFAWAASSLLAEEALPIPLVAGRITQVGAQTGFEVDDVAVLTDLGGGVFIQAKVGLNLGRTPSSPLAKSVTQAVRMYLRESIPEVGSSGRSIDPSRDAIVLCTNPQAPKTIREDLRVALSRTASLPPGTPIGDELTAPQKVALQVAVGHTRDAWSTAAAGIEPSDEQLRQFFKLLTVLVLDLAVGRSDYQASISVLHRALEDDSSSQSAWNTLINEGQLASEAREWRDRSALAAALSQHGVLTVAPKGRASDVVTLRERSAANLESLQMQSDLPTAGGVYIQRKVAAALRTVHGRQPVLVVGDAGSGKSAVLQDLASVRMSSEEVIVLRAEDVAGVNRIATAAPLQEVLRTWEGAPGTLVIDGVDALRGSADREHLSSTVNALAGTRWQVVASARSFDTRNSPHLQRAFAGEPLSQESGMHDARLNAVRHLLVSDLSDAELHDAVAPLPSLSEVLAKATPDLRRLLRNPFNLRLAVSIADSNPGNQQKDLLGVRNRVDLLGQYWTWRIRDADKTARESILQRLTSTMLANRRLQALEDAPTILGTDSVGLENLLSRGVLTAADGAIPGLGRILAFSHNILFDYATAIYVLFDPLDTSHLVKVLDADPTVSLVARPSFDLLVDLLWSARSTGAFWPMALRVAESEHVLASLAISSRVANLAHADDDLLELAADPGHSDEPGTEARHRFIQQLIGALRARSVIPGIADALVPLAVLAMKLAERASSSFECAALSTDLLVALRFRSPTDAQASDASGTNHRAAAIALLLDAARSEPARREQMAGILVREAAHFVGDSAEVREAMHRLLDDHDALAQWGGTVLTWFPEAVLPSISADPELAARLAVTSASFVETRDEDVTFGASSVLPLRESRKQQSQHAVWRLGELFPEICAADIVTATTIVCEALGAPESVDADSEMWPLVASGATGWLEHGYGFGVSLGSYGRDDEQKMLSALAHALSEPEVADADQVTALLVQKVHNADVWVALMDEPHRPSGLAAALFPAFESGSLLVHPDTFPHAAALLKAAASERTVAGNALEGAVANALELADINGGGDSLKDVLVGCLLRENIQDPSIAARHDLLGGDAPNVPPPASITTSVTPYSTIDNLQKNGVMLGASLESAARRLEETLTRSNPRNTEDTQAITDLANAFPIAIAEIESATDVPSRIELLLVQAASRLAGFSEVDPDHPCGRLIVEVLSRSVSSGDAGDFHS